MVGQVTADKTERKPPNRNRTKELVARLVVGLATLKIQFSWLNLLTDRRPSNWSCEFRHPVLARFNVP